MPFILQQSAWLYERQLSQVRAQMRKVTKADGNETDQEAEDAPLRDGEPSQGQKSGGSFDGAASEEQWHRRSIEAVTAMPQTTDTEDTTLSVRKATGESSMKLFWRLFAHVTYAQRRPCHEQLPATQSPKAATHHRCACSIAAQGL